MLVSNVLKMVNRPKHAKAVNIYELNHTGRGFQLLFYNLIWGFMKYTVEIGSRCHDIHTKFHKDWFRHAEVDEGGYTDSMVIA
jgi:hypothetical protein